ncbi:MAG TPA: tetratricopeptide repeat protein [Terriglobia bacterium]|nr:tetratricopeptide repeat protein [Terriglobia bacterium]
MPSRGPFQLLSKIALAAISTAWLAAFAVAQSKPVVPQTQGERAQVTVSAEFSLARADIKLGQYDDALAAYNQMLAQSPANYDALQGKAFIFYWTHQLAASQAIFQRLALLNPRDPENQKALKSIARAMDEEHWTALRPAPGAPPRDWLEYYTRDLAAHPQDSAAAEGLARIEAQLGMYGSAIRAGQRALRLNPSSITAQLDLARALAWNRQFAASVEVYNQLLRKQPQNREALEGLESVLEWSGRYKDALAVDRRLLALDPANADGLLAAARLELAMKDDRAAETSLASLLSRHPDDRWALLQMAQLQARQGRLRESLRYDDAVLAAHFDAPDALYGEARIYYFLSDPARAAPLAARAVAARPNDFDAIMLQARIERALRHPRQALALAQRAARIDPASSEAAALKTAILNDHRVTVHTTSTYARELAFQNASLYGVRYASPGLVIEDLDTYSSAIRTSFSFLPRSDSYVLLAATPSNTPFGPLHGAVAPAELMYGQSTRVSKLLTLRGGLGGVRMGPGEPYYGFATRSLAPVGYIGASLFLTSKLSLDFSASRAAITYTPASTRFGALETRIEGGMNLQFDSRTWLRASYFHSRDSSSVFIEPDLQEGGVPVLAMNGRDHGDGGTATFTRNLIHVERFSFDAGYSGDAFGYAGGKKGVYLGFFNPAFYQSHFLTTRAQGTLWGPLQYTLVGDVGVQQAAEGAPFTRAFRAGPALSLRVSRALSITAGYLHYNFAQSFGNVQGNAVDLETDWRF